MRWITAANTRRERSYIPLVRRDKNIYRLYVGYVYTATVRATSRFTSQYD